MRGREKQGKECQSGRERGDLPEGRNALLRGRAMRCLQERVKERGMKSLGREKKDRGATRLESEKREGTMPKVRRYGLHLKSYCTFFRHAIVKTVVQPTRCILG